MTNMSRSDGIISRLYIVMKNCEGGWDGATGGVMVTWKHNGPFLSGVQSPQLPSKCQMLFSCTISVCSTVHMLRLCVCNALCACVRACVCMYGQFVHVKYHVIYA